MSKTQILRGIITEKLTAAAQEILTAVERTVAGYEEEASGFREEIDRQRRQLEVLLQPQIKLERTDDEESFPVCQLPPEEESGGAELQYKDEPDEEDSGSLGLVLCYPEEQMEEERAAPSSAQADQQYLPPLDDEMASRAVSPTVRSDSSAGTHQTSEPQELVDFRIRILEDSQITVLSTNVFQKYPLQELQCPLSLPEADFLDLLKSTFPQLATDKPFDIFTTDYTRKLQPLKVEPLTPELIYNRIKSTGYSALYIRPKAENEHSASEEELLPPQSEDAEDTAAVCSPSSSTMTTTKAETEQYSRSAFPKVPSDRKKRGRRRTSEPQNHVDLRVCILEDAHISVLSPSVFQKYRLQELRCPLGLQEADFLDLLRSTFPQLAAGKTFDIFTTDHSRLLQPLRVERLTPELIYKKIRSTGYSALYIRLKVNPVLQPEEELQSTNEELHPLQTGDAVPETTRAWSPKILPRRRPIMRRTSEPQNHILLRIRILEDSQINVLSTNVFKKFPLQELRCPLGLQQPDFLNLLISTFPQLAAGKPFDIFTCDKNRRLQPLTVKMLTPEEIDNSIRSIGAGNSALYIRLKLQEEIQVRDPDCPSTADESRLLRRSLPLRVQPQRRSAGRHRFSEPPGRVDLRIRILEDSQIKVLSTTVFQKYPLQELQCPLGLQEADFLDLLSSTFPQLAADKPFDIFTTDHSRKLQPLMVETLTPELIYNSIKSSGNSALYIRLKEQEEIDHLQKETNSASTSDQTNLYTNSQSSHVEQTEEDVPIEGANDDCSTRSESAKDFLVLFESEGDGDDTWENISAKPKRRGKRSGNKKKRREPFQSDLKAPIDKRHVILTCKVCSVLRGSMNMLIKHAWSHLNNPEGVCAVCGEHSPSAEDLKSHLQSHQKTHNCDICGMYFISACGLRGHMARHRREKTYECKICRKEFFHKSALKTHSWVHVEEKPHKCDICAKSFLSKLNLKVHMTKHTGEKPYVCNVCNKSVRSFESLSQHMRTHSGCLVQEKTYGCDVCERRFQTEQQQQVHLKQHFREKSYACDKCSKRFVARAGLMAHMRVHTGEKPYKCAVCEMAFSQRHCVKRHMKTHLMYGDTWMKN